MHNVLNISNYDPGAQSNNELIIRSKNGSIEKVIIPGLTEQE